MDDTLRAELARRVEIDSETRRAVFLGPAGRLGEADAARLRAVDEDNTAWLRQVVAEHGWPTRSLVGDTGARHAWLLAQHADYDPPFQAHCLELLRAAVEAGEAFPVDLAYLTDRVLRARDEPQLYGTQLWFGPDGDAALRLQPVADPDRLDERRAAVGLEPLGRRPVPPEDGPGDRPAAGSSAVGSSAVGSSAVGSPAADSPAADSPTDPGGRADSPRERAPEAADREVTNQPDAARG